MANICKPLFHELSRAADSHDIRDQLLVLFRRDGYITKLQISDMLKEVLESIEILRLMQVDDMEKASRLALMAREIQDKVYEKNTFITKLREYRVG
ncbi:hypothetical protein Tco_0841454 [Tanacetum coccineum]|uniref:Uncharacterized protein n=1 Tax=Tanacetum coccineum TaxID=301880 RepID=A0ABQ5AYQ0_9ASTR